MAKVGLYTPGGTIPPGAALYIDRQADDDLRQICLEGEYAYVLTSRQMGKSSLMVRTVCRLREQGITSIIIDLSGVGKTNVPTADTWYLAVARAIASYLDDDGQPLTTDVSNWWEAQHSLTTTQRFMRFFRDVLLRELDGQIVVFIDEIDTTLALDFPTDDFFIAIRTLYTNRAQVPIYNRLSFVLIGVATPSSLIRDTLRTPFNIGHRVNLTDFTLQEALPLAAGLGVNSADQDSVFQQILYWTGGHPYLTQYLCRKVSQQPRSHWQAADVDEIVGQSLLGDLSSDDHNLANVRTLLLDHKRCEDQYQMLTTYREIWRDRRPVLDEEQSPIKAHLKLVGVVKRHADKTLKVRNPIYQAVFDDQWVAEHLPVNWHKWVKQNKEITTAVSLLLVVVMTGLTGWALVERNTATAARKEAIAAREEAIAERDNASQARALAEQRQQESDAARQEAEAARELASQSEREALQAREAEAEQRQQAELLAGKAQAATAQALASRQAEAEQRRRAEAGEAEARRQAKIADENAEQATEKQWLSHNSELISKSLMIQSLMAPGLDKQRFRRALELGHRIQALDAEALRLHTDNPRNSVWPSTRLQAISVLEGTFHAPGYLESNSWINNEDVIDIVFSPNGQMIAAAKSDGTIELRDISGRPLKSLKGHQNSVISLTFSHDGRSLASSDMECNIKIWNIALGHEMVLQESSDFACLVKFSTHETLASINEEGAVYLWDTQSWERRTFQVAQDIFAVSFSTDGSVLAISSHGSAARSGAIDFWNLESGDKSEDFPSLEKENSVFSAIDFSPDGLNLVTASTDRIVSVWDIRSGRQLYSFPGDVDEIMRLKYSPDGTVITSGTFDGTIKLWSILSTTRLNRPFREQTLTRLHASSEYGQQADDFLPLDRNLIFPVPGFSFSPDGQTLVTSEPDRKNRLWRNSGRERERLRGRSSQITGVSFSSDGLTLVSSSLNGIIAKWYLERKEGQELPISNHGLTRVKFSPDSDFIVISSLDNSVGLWNFLESRPEFCRWHDDEVRSVDFSSDSQTFASGGRDGIIKIWNISNCSESQSFRGHDDIITDIKFSPNGQLLATSSFDKTIKLWSYSGQYIRTFHRAHEEEILSIDFSPNGQLIASSSADGTIQLWNISGHKIMRLDGHTRGVSSINFAPDGDGQTLASSSYDGTVKLWDTTSGREIQTLIGHESEVEVVSFAPDGKTLASADASGVIILWDFELESLIDKLCNWWRDYLTYGNATDEEKALCPHITAPQPLPSTRFGPSQWLAHLQATWHAALGRP